MSSVRACVVSVPEVEEGKSHRKISTLQKRLRGGRAEGHSWYRLRRSCHYLRLTIRRIPTPTSPLAEEAPDETRKDVSRELPAPVLTAIEEKIVEVSWGFIHCR